MTRIIIDQNIEIVHLPNGDIQLKCKGVSPSPPSPVPPAPTPTNVMGTIDVQNFSTTDSDDKVKTWIAASKIQCDRDVQPIWGKTVNFNFIPKGGKPTKGNWQCGFFDNSDQAGVLGWHDVSPNGLPLIKCFTRTAEGFGESPSVTLSHEICECIGDPDANTTVKGKDENGKACLYFQELCDAVEAAEYDINGVKMSDFVTPDWFEELPKSNKMSFLSSVSLPFHIAKGGYMEISYDNGNSWTEVNKMSARLAMHKSPHSRWALYKKKPDDRVKSTFEMSD